MATVKPIITIATLATDPARKLALGRLLAELRPQCQRHDVPLYVYEDNAGAGSLGPWLHCLEVGAERPEATHVTFLPDDALLCRDFVATLLDAIAAKPDVIQCHQANHPKAKEVRSSWYTTSDGFTAFGGTMPVDFVREHLAWRQLAIKDGELVQGDEGVNLWALATGRRIYKSIPSLVDHDTALESRDGNQAQTEKGTVIRRSLVFDRRRDMSDVDWTKEPEDLGRSYRRNHFWMVYKTQPQAWNLDAMYAADRNGPVSEGPHVMLATPSYQPPLLPFLRSRDEVTAALMDKGVGVSHLLTPGDSLVTRARARIVHQFLKSPATHLLFWDNDISANDPDAVRKMLASGHDVVCGAYPLKDRSGRVVCNLWDAQIESGEFTVDGHGCVEVRDAGTGFMLVSRKALYRLMQKHADRLFTSQAPGEEGEPLWALYDTGLVCGEYLSEDYFFCHLWQELSERVYVYAPATFKHWGVSPYEGSLMSQYGATVQIAQSPDSV
jgi:hypothetical protein